MNYALSRAALLVGALAGCAGSSMSPEPGSRFTVTASWYGEPFHGRLTASGERYDMHALTAAHPSLPFGTRLLVTSAKTGRSTTVTVTDRGPFVPGRQLDLSLAAAHAVGLVPDGVGRLRVEVLDRDLRYRQRVVDTTAGPTPGPFAIQFGAFAERDHAVQLTLALASPRIVVEEAVVDGVRYYRVRMGPFASRAEAVKRAAAYAEEGYRPWVVQR